ncbi:MAG: restriction endonuclease subunit S [Enterococcus sp.]|nr:restriction endonuclease subunit S [Enterococcus sp.]
MFPKEGEKVPEVRFPGFTDDWEQRELGNLVDLVVREVPKPNEPYYRMSVRSHAKGTFRQFVDNPDSVAMDKLFVVKKDDLVVNITFAWEHAIAIVPEENDGLLVSHRFPTYRANGNSDIEFLHYLVSKEDFRRKLEFISPGGAGRNRVLNKKDFLKLKMYAPELDEQKRIGTFFKQLDNTISLHQRELELLQLTKKAFLQKLFV